MSVLILFMMEEPSHQCQSPHHIISLGVRSPTHTEVMDIGKKVPKVEHIAGVGQSFISPLKGPTFCLETFLLPLPKTFSLLRKI